MRIFFVFMLVVGAYKLHNTYSEYAQHKEIARMVSRMDANQRITMYSLTTCGFCKQKSEEFRALGIPFDEHYIDTDASEEKAFWKKMAGAGMPATAYGFPIFEINNTFVIDNPPTKELVAMMISPEAMH